MPVDGDVGWVLQLGAVGGPAVAGRSWPSAPRYLDWLKGFVHGDLGLEPGSTPREMEAAILRHGPSLDAPTGLSNAGARTRSVVVVARTSNANTTAALDPAAPVAVPFGGAEHEWAAAEVGAWMAAAEGRPLELVGAAADASDERRDASRLLASVALLVQQVAAVETTPSLVAPDSDAVAAPVAGSRVVILGLPDERAGRGLGATRAELVRRAVPPVLVVRGGLRPGGLAPAETLTRFTWTLTHHGT